MIPGYAVHASRLHVCQLVGSCVHSRMLWLYAHLYRVSNNNNNNKAVCPKRALSFVCVTCMMDPSGQPSRSAAQRRSRNGREYAPLLTRTEDCQGRGVGARDELHGHDPGSPHPSRSSSACTKSPAARGLTGSRRSGRRTGICGAQWTRPSMPCRGYRLSTFLCRRWWTNRWCCSRPSTSSFPSRLSKCPSCRRSPAALARFSPCRRQRNSEWKPRMSCLSLT